MLMRCLVALLLGLVTLVAPAADLAQSVRERLAQPPVLRGEFEQRKQVAGFKKPLLSRGDFIVARERGVLWRTTSPFASQLRLTRNEIVATQGGQVAFRLDAAKEPSVRMINALLFALLNGDIDALTEHFGVDGEASGQQWQLVLTPKSAALARLMTRVSLSGDQYVRQIDIAEANGDRTAIRFSAQHSTPSRLSGEEAARFD
ncbi:outer membrane lipoprotein carrier protein LolA [Chitinolyticbacter albus]|uniref:outer membrane lipoprotein carrier protein LolA n=1 Tax=Chitinolyticbacter albus TaxID=2961951 RepID=UPI002108D8CC|nr:outer membrane lipoprotein carrier protein LolA [Chitinolyticbacter albus]